MWNDLQKKIQYKIPVYSYHERELDVGVVNRFHCRRLIEFLSIAD